MKIWTLTVSAIGVALMVINSAIAGQELSTASFEEDGKQVYLPEYFHRFSPQTAADMVRDLPGFQIQRADTKRGLGQGGTNILINGSRVSGKSTDPMEVLGRTSNASVVRVEIVEGASLGISGLSGPVANVIIDNTERTGNWEWNGQFRKGLPARWTNGSISVSDKIGNVSYTLALDNDAFRSGAWGPEFVTGPDGELIATRYEQARNVGENTKVSLVLGHKDNVGREANFNASYTIFDFNGRFLSDSDFVDPSEPATFERFPRGEDEWNTEVSGDYAFDALGGRLKLIAFQYLEDSDFINESFVENDNGFVRVERFLRNIYEGESILRAEQTWMLGEERSFELAAEGVYNFVDTESSFFTLDEQGTETEVDLSGANTKIEERRAEISGTYNFPLGEKLSIQTSLAMEYSELEQSGDSANARTFTRPKGFVSASYDLTESLELRGQIEREVGQLDFFAFASSVDLQNGNDRAGNAELVPEQSWNYEFAIEKTFADDSQVTLSFEYRDIEDVVQRVPFLITDSDTGNRFKVEGVGNVPEATRWRVRLQGTQMLDRFGIKGGQLDYDMFVRDSEIEDPFSGELRRLNAETKWFYNFTFRHDIPQTDYAWGFRVEDFENALNFQGRQITLYDQSEKTIEIFAEHKDFFGMNATVYLFNLLDYSEDFRRDQFSDIRPDGQFLFREQQVFDFDPIFGINLEKTF